MIGYGGPYFLELLWIVTGKAGESVSAGNVKNGLPEKDRGKVGNIFSWKFFFSGQKLLKTACQIVLGLFFLADAVSLIVYLYNIMVQITKSEINHKMIFN